MKTISETSILSRVQSLLSLSVHLRSPGRLVRLFTLIGPFCVALASPGQTPISCGQLVTGSITNGPQKDIYAYNGAAGEVVSFAIQGFYGVNQYTGVQADIYDPSGNLLATIYAQGTHAANLTLATSEILTVEVHDHDYAHTGNYSVSVQDVSGGGCSGTSIACGQTVPGAINLSCQMNAYAYACTDGEVVSFAIQGFYGVNQYTGVQADIYDPSGNLLTTIYAQGTHAANLTLATSGMLTIVVHDHDFYFTGNYSVSVQDVSGGGCSGTSIACGQTVPGTIDLLSQMNAHAYAGTNGEVVSFAIQGFYGVNQYTGVQADIYDPSGNLLTTIYAQGTHMANLTLATGGILTVIVHDHDYAHTGSYSLNASDFAGCSTNLPTNSVLPIPAGTTATLTATAIGPEPLFYQWRYDGKPVVGATNAEYTVVETEPGGAGYYDVLVGDVGGVVASVHILPFPHAATATASVVNGYVVAANVTDLGWGYTNSPTVRLIGGGGAGAEAVAVITNGVVVAVDVQNPGSNYTNTPVVVLEPPFIPQPTMAITPLNIVTFINLAVGTNYQLQAFAGGVWLPDGTNFTATNSTLTEYLGLEGGFRVVPSPAPEQANATAQVDNGFVVGATVTDGGSGYSTNPAVTIVGNDSGTNATATATVSGGVVTGITITSPGSGYSNGASIIIAPPPADALSPSSVALVMKLDIGSLSPYDSYQLEFSPALGSIWAPSGTPLTSTSNSATLYPIASGGEGFFRVKYLGL